MTTQKIQEVAHPLLGKEISHIGSWNKWKELWEGTTDAELLHGLLHVGFDMPVDSRKNEAADRVVWYLNIADKHTSSWEFRTLGENEINNYEGIRCALAQKAFQVICQSFFKNTASGRQAPSWTYLSCHPPVLKKILWFFRLNEGGRIDNLGSDNHHSVIAAEFIRDFCKFAWDKEMSEAMEKTRPDMITLLFGLRELDILFNADRYWLDEKCLKRLEELAMGFDLWLPSILSGSNGRRPRTIEEACFGGSQAARVLLTLRVKQAEKNRYEKARELLEKKSLTEEELKRVLKSC